MILKPGQGPSIVELRECIRWEWPEEIMLEESPANDSRSNGSVERGIQTVQGQIRAIKDAFEARY